MRGREIFSFVDERGFREETPLLFYGDDFDFDQRAFGQLLDGDS